MKSLIAVPVLALIVGAGCSDDKGTPVAPNDSTAFPSVVIMDWDETVEVTNRAPTAEQLVMERQVMEYFDFQADNGLLNIWLEDANTGLRQVAELCAVSEGWVNDTLRVNFGVEHFTFLVGAYGADFQYNGVAWTGSDIVFHAGEGWKTSQPWASWTFAGANSAEPDSSVLRFGGAHWSPAGDEPIQLNGARSIFGVATFTAIPGQDWFENSTNFDHVVQVPTGCRTNIGVGQGYE